MLLCLTGAICLAAVWDIEEGGTKTEKGSKERDEWKEISIPIQAGQQSKETSWSRPRATETREKSRAGNQAKPNEDRSETPDEAAWETGEDRTMDKCEPDLQRGGRGQ